jgi:hypothetical protein
MRDGDFITRSEEREADLFCAIRGGGGNFDVVTSFVFRLHPVGEIYGGPTFIPIEGDVLQGYRDFIRVAPKELGALFAVTLTPPLPFLPQEWHGKPVSAVIVCWTGSAEKGEETLRPMREWAPVVGAHVGRLPYPALSSLFDELLPPGLQH